jgi:hypothetical protein
MRTTSTTWLGGLVWREMPGHDFLYFFKPPLPLLQSADNNDAEHFSRENLNSAQIEDAVLPDGLQRVSKDFLLSRRRCVGRIENKGRMRPEQTYRDSLSTVILLKSVGHSWSEDPIYPPLENCRRLPPPVRMNHDDTIRFRKFNAVLLDDRWQDSILQYFLRREMRWEALIAEIVKRRQVSCFLKSLADGPRNGVVEAASSRMGQNNKDFQAYIPSFSLANR